MYIYNKYHKNTLLFGTTVSAFNTHPQPIILFDKKQIVSTAIKLYKVSYNVTIE